MTVQKDGKTLRFTAQIELEFDTSQKLYTTKQKLSPVTEEHIHTYRPFRVSSSANLHVFMQTPHRKASPGRPQASLRMTGQDDRM